MSSDYEKRLIESANQQRKAYAEFRESQSRFVKNMQKIYNDFKARVKEK